jgi:succinoglycan biosynthesis protein ExoM
MRATPAGSAGKGLTQPLVVIAIPTFRRPDQLAHLLTALAALKDAPRRHVVLADNDAAGQAGIARAAEMAAAGYALPIDSFVVAEKGLCTVRNALLARALEVPGMTHVAMIDDDEWPDPQWLAALLRQMAATGADVVAGPVLSHFQGRRPAWAGETLVFRPEQRPAGRTDMLWGSNNLIVSRACLERSGPPWFDPAFNATGGEDVDLFTRWRKEGRIFAWAPDAPVNEWVPPERAQLGWVMRRMWRIGGTDVRIARKGRPGAMQGLLLAGRCMALLGLRTAALPLTLVPGTNRVDHAGQWVKSCGRIAALLGYGYREYG